MKPPPRKRTKRDLNASPVNPGRGVCQWPRVEQKKLLTALKELSKSACPLPDINPENLRRTLSTRSAEEIQSVVDNLKNKTILFAQNKLNTEQREERKALKPVEMWTNLASAVAGTVEESISKAFSQMFVVASTEPCTLKNSDPPQNCSPARPLSKGISTQAAGNSIPLPVNPGMEVSFERIYQYLSGLSKPNEPCKLTPMESAILLDLLMALPEELLLLDCSKLNKHLSEMYRYLSAPADSRLAEDFFKELRGQQRVSGEQVQQQNIQTDKMPLHSAEADWRSHSSNSVPDVMLYSPLNPFRIPVSLLSHKAGPEGPHQQWRS